MAFTYRYQRVQLIRRSRDEVFAFFADITNLEKITPPFLQFKILSSDPVEPQTGTKIDYRLRLFGLPFRWRSVIESWNPPHGFTDVQERGPYRMWNHRHEFYAIAEGTLCVDVIHYELPGGPLAMFIQPLFVRRSLDRIFDYRRGALAEFFGDRVEEPATT